MKSLWLASVPARAARNAVWATQVSRKHGTQRSPCSEAAGTGKESAPHEGLLWHSHGAGRKADEVSRGEHSVESQP